LVKKGSEDGSPGIGKISEFKAGLSPLKTGTEAKYSTTSPSTSSNGSPVKK